MSAPEKVVIEINTRNAAFRDEQVEDDAACAGELSRILLDLTDRLDMEEMAGLDMARLFDFNGNAVGTVRVYREGA